MNSSPQNNSSKISSSKTSSNGPTLAQKRKRLRIFAVGAALCIGGLAFALTMSALQDSVSLFITPADVAEGKAPPGRNFRLGGLVEEGSVEPLADGGTRFSVTDEAASLVVEYRGILPDLFREGQGVVTLGTLDGEVFQASEVLAKHDETYMPAEVQKALEERGEWRAEGTKADDDAADTGTEPY
ncbi:MAG: hypothetical protein Alpg2KO_21720 [Alphaproteobacteria bacterium]